ncbi:alpha-hydroxy acid oxidase [Labrys sp. LIt4]|uniref:alpha-hydroxy acid oxidase n=1 Tax=Labrys sp. LIt4 TaxID=2821355 RepID=UPI0032AFBBB1
MPDNSHSRTVITARRIEANVPRSLRRFLALEDFEPVARRHLPRQIYGYYAGAAETNAAHAGNSRALAALGLVPRVLVDTRARSTRHALFGHAYSLPVGIAPMGLSGLATFEGDLALAKAAAAEGALMVASATSLMPLERLAEEGKARWFQTYLPGEPERIRRMVARVAAAGYETLVLTADVPVAANRENNARTGFSAPLKPSLRLFWDGITHPSWSLGTFARTLAGGMPRFENMDAFRGPTLLSRNAVRDIGARDGLDWSHLDLIRQLWPGRLVVKGILAPEDVTIARERGVDGVWISNHGGRQLDTAIAPMSVLRDAVSAAGGMAVLIDGGFRRGTDVLKALALGADFVFVGRPFLFAAAVGGERGIRHALGLLQAEIARNMAMLGVSRLDELQPMHVRAVG